MGKLILFIGATGHGKTTGALKLIEASKMPRCFVYDYRGEPVYDSFSTDLNADRCKINGLGGSKEALTSFIEVARKKTNTWLLIEEATVFLSGKVDESMRELIVSKRHRGHNIIMLFHTIRTVPPFLFDMADYVFLHKTGDSEPEVKRKRPALLPYFNQVRRAANKYFFVTIKNV